jgi:hypothetical protein
MHLVFLFDKDVAVSCSLIFALQSQLKPFLFGCEFALKTFYFVFPLLDDLYKLVAFLNEFFEKLVLVVKLVLLTVTFYLQAAG